MKIKRLSITVRLTVFFSVVSSSVLLMLGLLIGAAVQRHFEEQDLETLDSTFTLVGNALARPRTGSDWRAITQDIQSFTGPRHGVLVSAIRPTGLVPVAAAGIPMAPTAVAVTRKGDHQRLASWTSTNGIPLWGQARLMPTALPGAPSVIVTAGIDLSQHAHFLHAFEMTLWSFVLAAAVVCALLGRLAVRYGLAPLEAIKSETEAISAHHLGSRLSEEDTPPELMELVRSLNDMLARLEASFQRLSEFSSDLAHELRTPVNALLTQTQVTLSRPRTDEEYQDVLAANCEELERLGRMVADMLFLAKADNHQIIPQRELIDLAKEASLLVEFYEALADERGLRIHVSGTAHVSGDRLMLRRAISNVMANAIRHCAPKSDITVHVGELASGEVCITIENSGETIPAEHLPKIFDRFYRVDASRQRFSDGAGLGLAITRSIMVAHGGDARAISENGRTVFRLILPAQE